MRSLIAAAFAAGLATSASALADEIVRHKIPNSDFPISRAVEVPADKTTVYLSGAVPAVAVEGADKNSVAAYGDIRTQTKSMLNSIDARRSRAQDERRHQDAGFSGRRPGQ